ncbi:MAG: T9SS type A sorting domain-containing protein [Chitinophagales bacterium]|nr:T9SS type A sorting domain-containing protein [Chitinophagales bacterium]
MKQPTTFRLAKRFIRFYLLAPFAVCILFSVCPETSHAQIAGTTETVTQSIRFTENFNNINLDPTPVIGSASRVNFSKNFSSSATPAISNAQMISLLSSQGISIPGWLTDLTNGVSFFCSGFNPYFNMSANVDAGGYYQIHSVGNADVAIDYPVEVVVTYPAANSFACGNEIRINTNYNILEPNNNKKLEVKPPFVNQEIGPYVDNLSYNVALGVSAYVGFGTTFYYPCLSGLCSYEACGGQKHFNEGLSYSIGTGLPSLPPLVNICENAFGPGANEASLLGCRWSPALPFLNIAQTAVNQFNASTGQNYSFAEFPDTATVTILTPDLPPNGPPLPDMEGEFTDITSADLNFTALNGGATLQVSGVQSEITNLKYDLISLLELMGYNTGFSLGGGMGSVDAGDISPTMTVDQTLDFRFTPVINLQLNLGTVMNYTVHHANGLVDYSATGQLVNLKAGQYIIASFPQNLSSPVPVSGTSFINGNFHTFSKQEYYSNIQLEFGKVDIPGILQTSLVSTATPKEKFGEKTILEHDFLLQGTRTINLAGFLLDPENPIIDITGITVKDIRNIGGGKRQVVYEIAVKNNGDVSLSNVQTTFNLAAAFATATGYQATCVSSTGFTVNPAYNGGTDFNLLAAGNTLAVGQTKTIEVLVTVEPEKSAVLNGGCFGQVNYNVSANAYGTSPIGTFVESNLNQCTMQATAPHIVTPVDLGAEVITSITDFTLFAVRDIKFDKNFNASFGNIGAASDVVFENVSHKNAPAVTIVGDIYTAEKVILHGESKVIADNAQVGKTVHIHNSKSSFNLTGVASQNSSCVTAPALPLLNIPSVNSGAKIKLAKNTTLTLAPGTYLEITQDQNTQLTLSSGVYNIGTWHIHGDNSTIRYQTSGGPITINVNKWQPHERNNLQFLVIGGGSTRDVQINYSGQAPAKFNNSLVQGSIYAPSAEVEFDLFSRLEGSCYAEKINFKNGSVFKGHKYVVPLNINLTCQPPSVVAAAKRDEAEEAEGAEPEPVAASNFKVYPNPAHNEVYIEGFNPSAEAVGVELYDLSGKLVKSAILSGNSPVLKIADLEVGMYFIKVANTDFKEKIIKY